MNDRKQSDIGQSQLAELDDHKLREQLQVAFDEADHGDVAPWNIDEFLRKMHAQKSARESGE